jgi:hypothetical protein
VRGRVQATGRGHARSGDGSRTRSGSGAVEAACVQAMAAARVQAAVVCMQASKATVSITICRFNSTMVSRDTTSSRSRFT